MLPDRQTLQGALATSAHLTIELLHRVRPGRDEPEGKQPVKDAGNAGDQHPETEGRGLQQMTEVGLADAGGMGGEEA